MEFGASRLPSFLPRLVSEQRAQRGDDFDQAGFNEVCDDHLDVLIRRWRFLVEQVALFADDPPTERRLHQLIAMEALAHPQPAFAAHPLASRPVRE